MKKLLPVFLFLLSTSAFSQQYWEDGFWKKEVQKRYERTGSMAGFYTTFYHNGQIKWQGRCDNTGMPDSVWVYYNDEGKLYWQGAYNGMNTWFNPDGSYSETGFGDTLAAGPCKNGVKEGEWTIHRNSNSKYTGFYHNGYPVGNWKTYDQVHKVIANRLTQAYDLNTKMVTMYDTDSTVTRTTPYDSVAFIETINQALDTDGESYETGGVDFVAGAQYIDLNPLNNHFLQKGHHGLSSPLLSGGVGANISQEHFYQHYGFNLVPGIAAQPNDSIRLNLNAFSFSVNYGVDCFDSKWINLAATLGIGMEQMRLKVSYTRPVPNSQLPEYSFGEGTYKVYKNPAPYVQGLLHLRLSAGSFSIAGMGGYILDCSGTKWRYNGRYLDDSPRTSASGFIGMVSIGIHFD